MALSCPPVATLRAARAIERATGVRVTTSWASGYRVPTERLLPWWAVEAGESDSGLRLAELVAAFSLASDLGLGQPMEHVLRSWSVAARLGDHLGVALDERGALYYVATLAWVGCVADATEAAAWLGADRAFGH